MPYKLQQRVKTKKYGEGVIVDFEVCHAMYKHCRHVEQYEDGARIGIKLDAPHNWPLHSQTSGPPYFYPSDIQKA